MTIFGSAGHTFQLQQFTDTQHCQQHLSALLLLLLFFFFLYSAFCTAAVQQPYSSSRTLLEPLNLVTPFFSGFMLWLTKEKKEKRTFGWPAHHHPFSPVVINTWCDLLFFLLFPLTTSWHRSSSFLSPVLSKHITGFFHCLYRKIHLSLSAHIIIIIIAISHGG